MDDYKPYTKSCALCTRKITDECLLQTCGAACWKCIQQYRKKHASEWAKQPTGFPCAVATKRPHIKKLFDREIQVEPDPVDIGFGERITMGFAMLGESL